MFCHHVHRVFYLHHQTFVMKFSYSVVRHLLRTGHYSNGFSLLRDAHAGEPGVLMLVHLLAQVRCNRRTRKTVPQIVVASKQNRKPRWLSVFMKQLYMLWSVLHKAARPTSKVSRKETLTGQPLTQGVRRVLVNCGVVTNRPVPLTAKATSAAQQLWSSMSNHQMAMWFDNWWWKRSTTDPEHPNPSMNLTVFAMLHTTDLCPFPGHPSLVTVLGQLDSAVHSTATALRSLNDVTRVSLDAEPEFIRVPLDIKRDNVRSLQFRPLLLTDFTTGGILDLLHILQEIQDIQRHTRRPMPLIIDMKIHFYLLRFLYGESYVQYNFHEHLSMLPCMYGAWHPYKHTALEVYKPFFPIFAALENCNLQVGAMVYHHRKLLHIEKVVVALLLVGNSVRVRIQRKLEWLQLAPASLSSVQVDTTTRWLQGLQSLLFSYVPALFALGVQVRYCNSSGRQPGTGQAAHTVLQWSLLLHLFLTGDWDAKTEYVRSLSVTLAVWQEWMSNTLGCFFAEEIGEALLSRLSARVKLHPTALSQPALMDLFLSMPHPRMGTKTLHGKLRTGLCDLFRARLRRFIAWCTSPQLLFAPFTTAKTTAFVGHLPEGHTFPKPIPDSVNEAALRKVFRKSVLLLLSNRSPPEGVTEYLDQCNFRRDPAEVAQLTSLMERFRTRNGRGKGGGGGARVRVPLMLMMLMHQIGLWG